MSRRISYVLPAPPPGVPLLSLPSLTEPRLGRTAPLLIPHPQPGSVKTSSGSSASRVDSNDIDHPRHCLGVTAIALDTTTRLASNGTPEGILYTGGRDGLVAGWELGLPMTRRRKPRWTETSGREARVRWERLELGGSGWIGGEDESEDDSFDDEDELDHVEDSVDEDIDMGDTTGAANSSPFPRSTGPHRRRELEYSERWMIDKEVLADQPPPPTKFRQSVQTHTDWVTDLLLLPNHQTLISCSSDRTIRAWNPHSADAQISGSPSLVGRGRDYVKVLAHSKQPNQLFSGGLDRQVYLWDVNQPRPDDPISSLKFPDAVGAEGGKGSVYALAADASGTLVAAGSPERIVRLWDPRTAGSQNGQSIAGLIGHTDNIRAILLSADGRHLMSASSDSTIKLWSLAAQRCLHTFTHHTDSVWSLFSDHPNLERFFSGDKAGHLVLTDVTGCRNDYSEGECILLSKVEGEESRRGTEGICQITGIDDEYIWTATGSADVKRWKDVGRKRDRVGTRIAGESRRSSIPGTAIAISEPPVLSPSMPLVDGFIPPRAKTTNVDYPRDTRSVAFADTPKPSLNPFDDNAEPSKFPMGWLGNSRRTSLSGAPTAGSIVSVTSSRNGGVEHLSGRNGISYLNMICLGLSEIPYAAGDEATAKAAHLFSNSVLSFSRSGSGGGKLGPQARVPSVGSLLGHTRTTPDPGDVARRDFEDREVVGEADALRVCPDEVIKGRHGLIRAMTLNDRQHVLTIDTAGQVAVWNVISGKCIGRFAETDISSVYQESGYTMQDAANRDSKEALDIVRERIEGESSTITWCTVDTRIGSLTVHMEENRCFDAEVYADEVGHHNDPSFKEDQRINLGKWVLANLFAGLLHAEAAEVTQTKTIDQGENASETRSPAPTFISLDRATSRRARSQSLMSGTGPSTPGGLMIGLSTPAITPAIVPQDSTNSSFASGVRTAGNRPTPGGLPIIPQSPATLASSIGTPMSPSSAGGIARSPKADPNGAKDYFSFRTGSKGRSGNEASPDRSNTASTSGPLLSSSLPAQTPGGSFMGKFKGFGNKSKKVGPEVSIANTITSMPEEPEDDDKSSPVVAERESAQLKLLSQIRSHPFQPPPPSEAPPLDFPPDAAVLISEESKDAGAWAVLYRSMVSQTERDMEPLEMAAPGWMLEYLFAGRSRVKEPVKLCFILEPWLGGNEQQRLPAMPSNNARLTANRVLRIRKVLQYIHDKLELRGADSRASLASFDRRNSQESTGITGQPSSTSAITPPGKIPARFGAVEQAHAAARKVSPISGTPDPGLSGEAVEEVLEVLCNGIVVPITMTLAATKQFIWQAPGLAGTGSSGMDVVLQYRWKQPNDAPA